MKIVTVGRSTENLIVVADKKVSAKHLLLKQEENGIISVQDLNSTNGTFVNDQKIGVDFVPLQDTDIILIGETTLDWINFFKEKQEENALTQAQSKEESILSEQVIEENNTIINKNQPDKITKILWIGVGSIAFIFVLLLMIWYFTNVVKP